MKLVVRLFFFFFVSILMSPSLMSQSQRQINEQLAHGFFNNKDYEKAAELYQQLYIDNRNYYYFSQYIECLIFLERFDDAERDLRSFVRTDNTSNKWKSQVYLAYVLLQNNEKDKSDKILKKLINDLPANKNTFIIVANLMRSKDFNEFAIMLYDRGADISSMDYKFFMEKADAYQYIRNYEKAIDNYLLYLEDDPNTYDIVKSRLAFLLRYDVDDAATESMRYALLKKVQDDSENEIYAELMVWYALQVNDYEMALKQELALDKRFGDREYDIIYLAKIACDNEQYDIAISAYDYLVKKSTEGAYYAESVVGKIEAEYMNVEKSNYGASGVEWFSDFEKRIEKECQNLGIYDKTIPILIIRADILAYRLNEYENAINLLENALNVNITRYNKARLKMKLADIYLFKEEVWEATLLYSQVDKSMKEEPIGHEARFKNAQLRYYIGEFDWALSVLNILKSATSKLIANDAMTLSLLISDNLEYDTIALRRLAKADYYIYQKRYDLANKMLDSINIYNPNEVSMPYLLMRKADVAMENQDYELADSLYKRVYQGYADSYIADDALLKDAVLLEKYLDKKEEAMECYAKIIDEYTASVYVAQARNAYRKIRSSVSTLNN